MLISWGTKRKLKYIFSIVFFFLFIGAVIVFFNIYKNQQPSCFDGKQNSDEQGIDCGGNCAKVCEAGATDVRIDWVRAFRVKDGIWSVAAYLENPNINYQAQNVSYKFRVYDSNNTLIAEPAGVTFIPAGQSFGVFEGWLQVGDRIPARATLEWPGKPNWTKVTSQSDFIIIKDVTRTTDAGGLPRVSAVLENQGLKTIKNIAGFVVVYDNFGNAIAASETIIDQVAGGATSNMIFSWPTPFVDQIGRVEILHWLSP